MRGLSSGEVSLPPYQEGSMTASLEISMSGTGLSSHAFAGLCLVTSHVTSQPQGLLPSLAGDGTGCWLGPFRNASWFSWVCLGDRGGARV